MAEPSPGPPSTGTSGVEDALRRPGSFDEGRCPGRKPAGRSPNSLLPDWPPTTTTEAAATATATTTTARYKQELPLRDNSKLLCFIVLSIYQSHPVSPSKLSKMLLRHRINPTKLHATLLLAFSDRRPGRVPKTAYRDSVVPNLRCGSLLEPWHLHWTSVEHLTSPDLAEKPSVDHAEHQGLHGGRHRDHGRAAALGLARLPRGVPRSRADRCVSRAGLEVVGGEGVGLERRL